MVLWRCFWPPFPSPCFLRAAEWAAAALADQLAWEREGADAAEFRCLIRAEQALPPLAQTAGTALAAWKKKTILGKRAWGEKKERELFALGRPNSMMPCASICMTRFLSLLYLCSCVWEDKGSNFISVQDFISISVIQSLTEHFIKYVQWQYLAE